MVTLGRGFEPRLLHNLKMIGAVAQLVEQKFKKRLSSIFPDMLIIDFGNDEKTVTSCL